TLLELLRQRYLDLARINSEQESFDNKALRSMYEWMVGKKNIGRESIPAKATWHFSQGPSVTQRLRSGAFHLLLGVFNPVQVFLQASGGAVAMSVLPLDRAGKVAKGMVALTVGLNTHDDAIAASA